MIYQTRAILELKMNCKIEETMWYQISHCGILRLKAGSRSSTMEDNQINLLIMLLNLKNCSIQVMKAEIKTWKQKCIQLRRNHKTQKRISLSPINKQRVFEQQKPKLLIILIVCTIVRSEKNKLVTKSVKEQGSPQIEQIITTSKNQQC